MFKEFRRGAVIISGVWFMASAAGCATASPQSTGRHGFFEALSDGGRPVRQRRYSALEEEEEPAPPVRRAPAVAKATVDPKVEKVRVLVQNWRWPLSRVVVTSPFGERGSSFHEGVDLAASVGTPVMAAEGGKVVFAGSRIRGYGKMVILKHPKSGLLSVYAHLSKFKVKLGQQVHQGQKIALSGQTGRVTGPHLHFEIRRGIVSYDPKHLLTASRKAAARVVAGR